MNFKIFSYIFVKMSLKLNNQSTPFYPKGYIVEKRKYDQMEREWMFQNKKMFEDTFEDTLKYMQNNKFEYKPKTKKQKVERMETIKELDETKKPTYASVLINAITK